MKPHQGKIFGIGLSKTGTSSLAKALDILGYRAIHCPQTMAEIEEHDAATDTPVAAQFRYLDERYPDSRFIYTVRNMDSWLLSCQHHWNFESRWPGQRPSPFGIASDRRLYGHLRFDRKAWRAAYHRHDQNVRSYFAARPFKDLLIMDITAGDAWDALCPFLGKAVPDIPFPHANVKRAPSVTVTICSKPRLKECARAIAAVNYANLPQGAQKRLVINSENAPLPQADLGSWSVEREPRKGIQHARNRAVRGDILTTQFIAFLDDDDEAHRGWLNCLLKTQRETAADIVFGYWHDVGAAPRPQVYGDDFGVKLPGRIGTCNVLISRRALDLAGQPSFRFPAPGIAGGEDTDFFIRAVKAGATWAFAGDSLITRHYGDRNTLWGHCHRYYQYGFTNYHAARQHAPENLHRLAKIAQKNGKKKGRRLAKCLLTRAAHESLSAAFLRFCKRQSLSAGFLAAARPRRRLAIIHPLGHFFRRAAPQPAHGAFQAGPTPIQGPLIADTSRQKETTS
jgi:GT2 family glycosyltransferase